MENFQLDDYNNNFIPQFFSFLSRAGLYLLS